MTEYAICFDFPDQQDPWFAGNVKDALGFVWKLEWATRFESEEAAARTLENGYGEGTRPFGCVVEIGQ